MKKIIVLLVLCSSQSINIFAKSGIVKTLRRTAPYVAVSALRAQSQIEQLRHQALQRSLQQQSLNRMHLTRPAHSTTSFEHAIPAFLLVDNKPKKMTSGSTKGKDPQKEGCIRPGKSQPDIRDKQKEPKREKKDSSDKKNKENKSYKKSN